VLGRPSAGLVPTICWGTCSHNTSCSPGPWEATLAQLVWLQAATMAVLETEPQHSGSGSAWQRSRTPASTARSPPPSRLAPGGISSRRHMPLGRLQCQSSTRGVLSVRVKRQGAAGHCGGVAAIRTVPLTGLDTRAAAHLTERQQLALALEESRRAAAAAARKGLLSPMSGSSSGSDSESEVRRFADALHPTRQCTVSLHSLRWPNRSLRRRHCCQCPGSAPRAGCHLGFLLCCPFFRDDV
jgi:hypothetical protein